MRKLFLLIVAMLAICGCDTRLPSDPHARFLEVRSRIEKAKTSNEAMSWLSMIADDGRPETRDLMLSFITGKSDFRAIGTINLVGRKIWLDDPVMRNALKDYYLDPFASYRRRARLRFSVIKQFEKDYAEFRDLPDVVPVPPGLVHVEGATP